VNELIASGTSLLAKFGGGGGGAAPAAAAAPAGDAKEGKKKEEKKEEEEVRLDTEQKAHLLLMPSLCHVWPVCDIDLVDVLLVLLCVVDGPGCRHVHVRRGGRRLLSIARPPPIHLPPLSLCLAYAVVQSSVPSTLVCRVHAEGG
jgi:hypothetical protein